MYGRTYGGRELRFEASGGLVNAALVMRDKETGSYWPILMGRAETGPLAGTRLEELAVGVKVQWKDWVRAHPDTLVLSVRGVEHVRENAYGPYLSSSLGFGGLAARDKRLPTKEPIWAFEVDGRKFAVRLRDVEGGAAVSAAGRHVFLYRPSGAALPRSTRAFVSAGRFAFRDGVWTHVPSGAVFAPDRGVFAGQGPGPEPLAGFDTFWYAWSLTHPDTALLSPVE